MLWFSVHLLIDFALLQMISKILLKFLCILEAYYVDQCAEKSDIDMAPFGLGNTSPWNVVCSLEVPLNAATSGRKCGSEVLFVHESLLPQGTDPAFANIHCSYRWSFIMSSHFLPWKDQWCNGLRWISLKAPWRIFYCSMCISIILKCRPLNSSPSRLFINPINIVWCVGCKSD